MSELWAYMKSFKWYEWGENNLGFQLWTRENKLPLYTNVNESSIDNPSFYHPGEEAHQEASKRIINSNIMETL